MRLMKHKRFFLFVILLSLWTGVLAHEINLPPELADPEESLITVKSNLSFTEGPAMDGVHTLFFTDLITDTIWSVTKEGTAGVFRRPSNKANGLGFHPGGELIACEKDRVTGTDMDTGAITVIARIYGPGEPNDLCFTPGGGIFFTSPLWDDTGDVYYLSPKKEVKKILSRVWGFPNGIEFDAQDKFLYVAMTQRNEIWKYSVDYKMNLHYMGVFASVVTPDGCAFDEKGNLWVASHKDSKIVVLNSTGKTIGTIKIDNESVQNLCFGGPGNTTLYITARTAVYSLKVKVRGK
jgi:gluconolactonase